MVLPTVSMAVLLLLHRPPLVASVNVLPGPVRDTEDAPIMAVTVGVVFTVTTAVAMHKLVAV